MLQDRDELTEDLIELEELRTRLSDSFFVLRNKIKESSLALCSKYIDELNSDKRCFSNSSDILIQSHDNDNLLNEFTELGEQILMVESKINNLKKNMEDN